MFPQILPMKRLLAISKNLFLYVCFASMANLKNTGEWCTLTFFMKNVVNFVQNASLTKPQDI